MRSVATIKPGMRPSVDRNWVFETHRPLGSPTATTDLRLKRLMNGTVTRHDSVDKMIGREVARGQHHAGTIDHTGKRRFDRAPTNATGCACSR